MVIYGSSIPFRIHTYFDVVQTPPMTYDIILTFILLNVFHHYSAHIPQFGAFKQISLCIPTNLVIYGNIW